MSKMGSLSEYEWDTRYSSATHNLINDFFIPAISRSRFYYRIAGYFSSMSIAAAFRGISAFIKNGEKMFLIIGSELTKDDVEAINNGLKKIDEVLFKRWEECHKDFENDVIKKRFELLAWLIANEKLEIKIGINKDRDGNYLPSNQSIFHEKILIFEDYDGNKIQIDGSINETWKAWKKNRESFCVHKSWAEGNEEFIRTAKEGFDNVWLNLDSTCEALELPEAIKKNLLSIKPKHRPEIEDEIDFAFDEMQIEFEKEKRKLRRYQEEAIEKWKENDYVGILEMATGTGKTYTALRAIKGLDLDSKFLLIGVPQTELAIQWADECESVFSDKQKRIILCYGSTDWRKNLSREIRQTLRKKELCIIITVLNTLRKPDFIKQIVPILDKTYLILDEVHEMGSRENRKVFEKFSGIKYRLGLSATPERAWDDEGNEAIGDYFKSKPIFVWDMEKAICPPEGYEPCLVPYEYHIHDCHLTDEESTEYEELSLIIKRKMGMLTKDGKFNFKNLEDNPYLKKLMFKRSEIIKKCQEKFKILASILDNDKDSLTKCLIYCNDEKHMDYVSKIIVRKGIHCRKFFGQMNREEREKVFEIFKDGDIQFLVAIKCLDQGIDLPSCNSAIILTSSRNPREFIQRRGRILRLHPDKERAIVHDIMVFPCPIDELKSGRKKLHDFEANLLKNQLKRIDIFIDNCINKSENLLKKLDYGTIITDSMRDE